MKKVLSVLLAAAMVMGMSVSAFADEFTTFGAGEGSNDTAMSAIEWKHVIVVDEDGAVKDILPANTEITGIEDGDVFYFPIRTENGVMSENADVDWKIKLKGDEYVKSAVFSYLKFDSQKNTTMGYKLGKALGVKDNDNFWEDKSILYVKVTLEDDVAVVDDDSAFTFYIYDRDSQTSSEKVKVGFDFITTGYVYIDEDDLDWALSVNTTKKYVYDEDSAAKKATVEFSDVATGEFKMYPDKTYKLGVDVNYNETLSEELDVDVEEIVLTLGSVGNIDLVLLADEDEYQVVAIDGDEVIAVEAEYVEDHKFADGTKVDGYMIENAEYTTYALIDADVEIAVEEEVEAPVETPVEAEKANPETGAADFVGAAVAMAVVSVAAAGALALKK